MPPVYETCALYGWLYQKDGTPIAGSAVRVSLAQGPVTGGGIAAAIAAASTTTDATGYWHSRVPYSAYMIIADGPRAGKQSGVRIEIDAAGLNKAIYVPSQGTARWDQCQKLDWSL
jgi:hypothetical protein